MKVAMAEEAVLDTADGERVIVWHTYTDSVKPQQLVPPRRSAATRHLRRSAILSGWSGSWSP
jgi:hypothetical protein